MSSITNKLPPRAVIIATSLFALMLLNRILRGGNGNGATNLKSLEDRRKNNVYFLRRFFNLFTICVPSATCKEAWYMLLLTLLLLLRTALSIINVKLGATTATHFVSRRWTALYRSVRLFALLSIPAAIVNAALKYVQDMLSIRMRRNLSQHINKRYLDGTSFLKAAGTSKAEHPDKVITKDIEQYSEQVGNIYCHLLKPALDVIIYTVGLGNVVGWQGPAIIWAYFGIRQELTNLLITPGKKRTHQKECEMKHQKAHHDIINDSDEIAFNGGASRDRLTIQSLLDAATTQCTTLRAKHALVTAYDTLLLKYGASVAGYAVLLSPYHLGLQRVKFKTSNVMMRDYIVCLKNLTELNRGIKEIEDGFRMIAGIEECTINVAELLDNVDACKRASHYPATFKDRPRHSGSAPGQANDWVAAWKAKCRDEDTELGKRAYHGRRSPPSNRSSPTSAPSYAQSIQFHKVALTTPDGEVLVKDLSFAVEQGENLLITGRKASGKTAIFRTLGGLWKLYSGSISKPAPSDMHYLPETTHLIEGTLRDQIIYPHTEDEFKSLGINDCDLARLLCLVDHSQSILGTWSLNEAKEWTECLSAQQRQCIGIARMYYHMPRFAMFDECTSYLSEEVEEYVYATCKALDITVVTAARDASNLKKFHKSVLSLTPGGYSIETVSE